MTPGGSLLDPNRSLEQRRQAVANLFDFVVRGGVADTRRTPSDLLTEEPKWTLRRYRPGDRPSRGLPILLVPPLGSQAACFDLRRGCSLAEHLVQEGRPTYLVSYDDLAFTDRSLGLEFWVNEVLPPAIAKASEDAGGRPVQLVGWCMGGLFALGTAAVHTELPINSVAMVASPFDTSKNPLVKPVQLMGKVTGGQLVSGVARVVGGLPSPLVSAAFKLTALPAYAKKPVTLFNRRDDREFLAHVEAVDGLMNNMVAYPGRATIQVWTQLVLRNELAGGTFKGPNRTADLADVRVPVMNIAGTTDVLVPVPVAHHVGQLLPNAREVRLETAPGGHLGVLTGRSAPTTTWVLLGDFLDAHASAA